MDHLRIALKWLQHMTPSGVGAKDLSECLELQLRALPRGQAQMIAIIICKRHLELLARRDHKKLMALTGADDAYFFDLHGNNVPEFKCCRSLYRAYLQGKGVSQSQQ